MFCGRDGWALSHRPCFHPLLPYSGSSHAHLKLLENDIMSIFPNFFVLTGVSCLSSETGLFKNRYYVPLNSRNHMGMGLFLSLAAYNFFSFFLVKPKSSQGLFLRIILKRKRHVNHTVVVMATVLYCPSVELPHHKPQGTAQT